jgi:formylglycine-generating enzyme required for sulfatase activity/predicted MPP superfamily phosphohydrolase
VSVDLRQRFEKFATKSVPNFLIAFAGLCLAICGTVLAAHEFWKENFPQMPAPVGGANARPLSDALSWPTILTLAILLVAFLALAGALLTLITDAWRALHARGPMSDGGPDAPQGVSSPEQQKNSAGQPPATSATAPHTAPAATKATTAPLPDWHPVRVIHLSDLHFSATTAWDSKTVLGRLKEDVAKLRAEVGEIHLVVVTGDIADFGAAEEYAQATKWLTEHLAPSAGVNSSKIRVVPGNHDVHRRSITKTASALAKGMFANDDPQQAIAEVLNDPEGRALLLKRQAAYVNFAQTFHPGLTVPWWSERLPTPHGLTVHLAGFNSAWLSASDYDRGNLVLSRWQCNELLNDAENADLTIALLHHPWDYLKELDNESQEAIRLHCGVILHGHMHHQKSGLASDPDLDVLQLAAGASYAGAKWSNAYQLLELDPMRGEARVHFRLWYKQKWIPDRNRYQKAPDGVATLPLRRSPNAPPPPPPIMATPATEAAPSPTPRARYAALLKDQLGKLPDVFRVAGGPRTIEAVWVEVTLAAQEPELDFGADAPHGPGRKVGGKFIGGAEDLHGRVPVTRVLDHSHRRWGLLGDPGSGKTTLLRHVAIELLRDERGPLPIYLKVADLEHGLAEAVTALCASFNTLGLADYLLNEAQAGRAVLLIDGLDEAVDLLAARKWVVGAATEVGENSQVIVASRPIEYTEPSAAFITLTLCPLGGDEQTELLTRWVTDRAKVHGALVRLSRTPRLRRLAENPLLLTLVGLLLRAGQDVPSRRGDLYERALKLLLTRDHDNEDTALIAPMREPDLTLELLGWAALRLHGLEGEAYRRDTLINALEADARNAARLGKHWTGPAAFIAEVAERTGLLIPDTGRVRDANAYSFPHRTFREFLAATALERDMGAVGAGVVAGAGELSRVFAEGKARPERWAEVLALTCGRLGPGGADALVQRITKESNSALLLRVVADAEGISAETVRDTLKLELGWEHAEARQKVIEEIPALVKDLAVAVGLLEQVARNTTCGHDLFWVREVLRRIERGEVAGGVLNGSVEDAKRAAKGVADNVLSHLSTERRAELLALLQPWWRSIPAGSFGMGGDEYDDEIPIHRVTFTSGFQILGVPVTWAMYRLFDPGHDAARDNFDGKLPPKAQDEVPVYNVSWFASVMFAEWVGARLPLEPEWEYACRAETTTRFWSGDTDEDVARVGWTNDNRYNGGNAQGHPHPVAQKPKNAWGLYDVHGNVWEWCLDERGAYAARADGLTVDPMRLTFIVGKTLPMSAESADCGALRVQRGGSWLSEPDYARSALRNRSDPSNTDRNVGFRLLMCPPDPP